MRIKAKKFHHWDIIKHETKRSILTRFFFVLAVFIGYLAFISQKYGAKQGFFTAILTWSFFVLCTPIADAGFLIDFPLRLITNMQMVFSEIIVWAIAISINLYAFYTHAKIYTGTAILVLFRHILERPFPFWGIIIISAIGTFASIRFGDELLDKTFHKERAIYNKHKHRYKFIVMIFVFGISLILYNFLLKQLGINSPI